ncbi:hypothetical protein PIB30_046775 [Stylosanthes scabra]|uniref:SCP domain-containing protein n=1 Tax=Stylosanthes scabra TaxID=79078 RepID=A0ABU6XEA7_9FABA|nr:hypothetical protein [Stylosanthes scabra]
MKMLLKIWVVVTTSLVMLFPMNLIAQNSPKDFLKAHNAARAEVGSKPLIWDKKLESFARKFLKKHVHDCLNDGATPVMLTKYAQNTIYNPIPITAAVAVAWFVKEKKYYDYQSNSCIGDPDSCYGYLQVVWSTTTFLGCASELCHHNKGILIRCHYVPHANFTSGSGERPYPYTIH